MLNNIKKRRTERKSLLVKLNNLTNPIFLQRAAKWNEYEQIKKVVRK